MNDVEKTIEQGRDHLSRIAATSKSGKGGGIGILGESGIGKSHLLNELSDSCSDVCYVVKMKGHPTALPALASVYDALFNAISSNSSSFQHAIGVLKRSSLLLPGFGDRLKQLLDYDQLALVAEFLKSSGVNLGTSPTPQIVRFLKELAGKRPLAIICDDAQWIDDASWAVIAQLAEQAHQVGMTVLFTYNTRAQSWVDSRPRMKNIDRWRSKSAEFNHCFVDLRRYTRRQLPQLCKSLLKRDCQFAGSHFDLLHKYSAGIPQHLRALLTLLVENGHIAEKNGCFLATCDWDRLDFASELRNGIARNVERIYLDFVGSRPVIEIASVIGEQFRDEDVDGILEMSNSFALLTEVSGRYTEVRYIFSSRHWAFDHTLVRDAVYRSIGDSARSMHRQVAEHFADAETASPITIAFHYQAAGEHRRAVSYQVREVRRLVKLSMYEAAESLLDEIGRELLLSAVELSSENAFSLSLDRGQINLSLGRYSSALADFQELVNTTEDPEDLALCHRRLGLTYLALDTQEDSQIGLEHCERAVQLYEQLDAPCRSELGLACMELAVAHSHLNDYIKAEETFRRGEGVLRSSSDRIAMAKLQRRATMFMDGRLSNPLLLKVADVFAESGLLHERIRALINAASSMLYTSEFTQARRALETAASDAADLNGLGLDCVFSNLAILDLHEGAHEAAAKNIRAAKEHCVRHGAQVIIDINDAVIKWQTHGTSAILPVLERAARQAYEVGEDNYIMPAEMNIAFAEAECNRWHDALSRLQALRPIAIRSPYNHAHYYNAMWYRLMCSALTATNSMNQLEDFRDEFDHCSSDAGGAYYEAGFCVVTLQTWSA